MNITIGAPKVLGIEIDNGVTRVVEMDFKSKSPKIYHAFTVPTPLNLISEDGLVQENEKFRQFFKETLARVGVSADRAAFSISSARIINREIAIPMVKESKIETLLYQNASDYFPVNISDYKLIYNVLGKTEEDGKRMHKLLVCAVPRDIIRSYYQFANYVGLDIAAIDFAGNGVFQAVKASAKELVKETVGTDKTQLFVSVYSEHAVLTFVKEGTICLQRMLSVGSGALMAQLLPDAIDEEEPISFDGLLRNRDDGVCYSALERGDDPAYAGEKARCTRALRSLVVSIRRSVEYYLSTTTTSSIEVYLLGGSLLYGGFNDLLAHELDLPVLPLENELEKKYAEAGDSFAFSFAEFAAPIGACIHPINLANRQQASSVSALDVFNDRSVQNTLLAIGVVCFLICSTIAGALVYMSQSDRDAVVSHESMLNAELIALGNTTKEKTAYQNAVNLYEALQKGIDSMDKYMETYNDHFVEFIEELERKMPAKFKVFGISVSDKGVVMNIRVSTREEAAYVIQTLRNCASVVMGTPSAITITQDSKVTGYNIDALLDADGHLSRENLATKYEDYTQEKLDALIPLLESGVLSPADVYSNYVPHTYLEYSVDESVLAMIELMKPMYADNPLVQRADTLMDAMVKYLNTNQTEDLSVLNSYTYVNNNVFQLSDFDITEEDYNGYLEKMESFGYTWETIFIKSVRTEYTEEGSGIKLPQQIVNSEILSFTVALQYTGEFEEAPEGSEEASNEIIVLPEGSEDEESAQS